ncbi:hypothetical protein KP509_13G050400 [Ceratopteris richardii]|nr:hypothetical protein KP509_13G050400 [Ceratopteris richardii]
MEAHEELGSHLVDFFVHFGFLCDAQRAFNRLEYRTEYSWTTLISGYAEYGDALLAHSTYLKMKEEGMLPSKFTFLALLKACRKLKCPEKCHAIHAEILDCGFGDNLIIRNSLIDTYAKCGSLNKAKEAFDETSCRDVITWNVLLAGFAENHMNTKVINYACWMSDDGIFPDACTYLSILKACRGLKDIERGFIIHAELVKEGYEGDLLISSSLLELYLQGGLLVEAQNVFDEVDVRDASIWTALITGYTDHGQCEEALKCFGRMQEDTISPNPSTYISALKACSSLKAVEMGRDIYSTALKTGYCGEVFLGNTLVDMYAKCGFLDDARRVFDTLPVYDSITWSSLLSAYAEHCFWNEVLEGFKKMQEDNVHLSISALLCVLKACSSLELLEQGQTVHVEIVHEGYEDDAFICSALIDMYAKCGMLLEAQDAFDNSSVKDVVTWTTMITGLVDAGWGNEALNYLKHMQERGLSADETTFVCSLKACISIGDFDKGYELHGDIIKQGIETNAYIANSLMELYSNFGSIADAQLIFDRLPGKDIVSWNSIIAGFSEQGFYEEALSCFKQMGLEGVQPNVATYLSMLKVCADLEMVDEGRFLHTNIVINQLEQDLYIGNNIIGLYAKVGQLLEAHAVFDGLSARDVFSWNALFGGYVDYGLVEEPLMLLPKMQLEGISLSPVTYMHCLKACIILENIGMGHKLYSEIICRGLDCDQHLQNSLIDMYGECGSSAEKEYLLENLCNGISVSWTVLIAACAEHGLHEKMLYFLHRMRLRGILPDHPTFKCMLKASSFQEDIARIHELHLEILKRGLNNDLMIENAILDAYVKQDLLMDATAVFKRMPSKDVISWTSMILGYLEDGQYDEALCHFEKMKLEGVHHDIVSYSLDIKVCGFLQMIHRGQEIHCEIVKKGLEGDPFTGRALVGMYAKVGAFQEACKIHSKYSIQDPVACSVLSVGYLEAGLGNKALTCFEQMQLQGIGGDVVSWSIIIMVYLYQGENSKALHVLNQILEQGLLPDTTLYLNILQACSNAASLEMCKVVHAQLHGYGLKPLDSILLTALIDSYSKCGSMREAQQVFNEMPVKDTVAWNALLAGYANQGERELFICFFNQMGVQSIELDQVAFLTALTVCCHSGLLAEAQELFRIMTEVHSISPTVEHFNCMADLLGRAGHLSEVVLMLGSMPLQPDCISWNTILASCQRLGDLKLYCHAFHRAVDVDDDTAPLMRASTAIYFSEVQSDLQIA